MANTLEREQGGIADRSPHCPREDIFPADYELTHRDKRYKIQVKIGRGGFGQIYSAIAENTGELLAVKVESGDLERDSLTMEQYVYRQCQGGVHVPKLFSHGSVYIGAKYFRWIAIELLGKNLSELRRMCQSQGRHALSPNTTFRMALQAIDALKHVHSRGFVHRDIKPSNLCLGLKKETLRLMYIIDFGLARRWNTSMLERARPGFRGTVRYASINAHNGRDLSAADDLSNLWYMMVEMAKGELPWRRTREKECVRTMKVATTPSGLLEGLDPSTASKFVEMWKLIEQLGFQNAPNYSRMKIILAEGVDKSLRFDWETLFL